jgi:hypothetical protein
MSTLADVWRLSFVIASTTENCDGFHALRLSRAMLGKILFLTIGKTLPEAAGNFLLLGRPGRKAMQSLCFVYEQQNVDCAEENTYLARCADLRD